MKSPTIPLPVRPLRISANRGRDSEHPTEGAPPAGTERRPPRAAPRLASGATSWLVPILLLLTWEVASATGILPARILPAPGSVWRAAADLAISGDLWRHLAVSAARAVTGLLIGGGLGFAFGILTGASRFAEGLLDGTVQMLRTIPNLALIPLVIVWFGIGEEAKVFLIAVGVFFPLYLNTYHGVRSVDQSLIEMARSYGLGGTALFRQVLLPGAIPSILVGLRFALGSMWLTLIAAEALAAESGIGFMTTTAREFMQTDVVLVGTILYALLGKLADSLAKLLERRLLPWHTAYQPTPTTRP
ncbi:MAG: ABC transporter permease subunit [Cytophagales bacterium]|nr:ABC transporter permease subunit [Armatimonadota bacterium]